MRRRKILGGIGVMGIPGIGKASSLYGTPVSVSGPLARSSEPLRLLLDSINIPAQTMPLMTRFGAIWEGVLGNESDRRRFQRDPSSFLEENGIPKTVLEARDQEVVLLKAMTDDDIMRSALSGDYLDFLKRLKALGITSQTGKSALRKQVLAVLRANLDEIKGRVARIGGDESRLSAPYAESRELAYLYGHLAPSIEQIAVAAVPVAIAAIAVVYVSVAAAVTVGIMAGIYISLAVSTGVTVGSNDCSDSARDTLFAGPASMPQAGRSVRQRRIQHAIAQRELLGKRMLVLSPERLQEAQQAARLARLLNQGQFVLEANRQLIKDEVSVFLEAAVEVGLLQIPVTSRPEVVATIQNIALRAAALD